MLSISCRSGENCDPTIYNDRMTKPSSVSKIKGVVLAGGHGTRLHPMTRVTNKHLLPVYDRPMIHFPLESLSLAGVEEVLLVTGGNRPGDFVHMLGNGREFGFRELSYAFQEGAGGIADALRLAEDFADDQPLAVVLGDNLIGSPIAPFFRRFREQLCIHGGRGAHIVVKKTDDPERFGVAQFDEAGEITSIVEKPKKPVGRDAVIGLYFYDSQVFDIIRSLLPSDRGELEITDVNRHYLTQGELGWSRLEGWWSDAGTVPSLYRASQLVADRGANGGPPAREKHVDDVRPRSAHEVAKQ